MELLNITFAFITIDLRCKKYNPLQANENILSIIAQKMDMI